MKYFYFGWIGKRKPYYHDTGINDTRLCWVIHSPNVDCISCEYIVISFECDKLIVYWSFFEIKRTFYDIFLTKLFKYIILLTAKDYQVIIELFVINISCGLQWKQFYVAKQDPDNLYQQKKNFSTQNVIALCAFPNICT